MQPQRVVAAVRSPVVAQPHKGDRALTPELDEADPPPLVVGHTMSASRSARGRRSSPSARPTSGRVPAPRSRRPAHRRSLMRAAAGPVSAGRRAGCARTGHRAPAARRPRRPATRSPWRSAWCSGRPAATSTGRASARRRSAPPGHEPPDAAVELERASPIRSTVTADAPADHRPGSSAKRSHVASAGWSAGAQRIRSLTRPW